MGQQNTDNALDKKGDIMTIGEPYYIKLTRLYDASPAVVFSAWTDIAQLQQWFAPRSFTLEEYSGDIQVDGAWLARMISPQGADYSPGGTYREIVAPERLVFTQSWDDENGVRSPNTVVTVTLSEFGGKTLLVFYQEGFSTADSRNGHESGWCTCLERLQEHLED
ncbi:MAG: SRPBCC family protein [Gammaproteobacteria bacterium WSBS_2016_MAG_OTU1]